jgi:hypothetical protein
MKFNLSLVFLAAVVSGQVESQIDSNTSQKQKIKQRGVRNKSSKVAVAPIPDAPIADPVAPLTKMPDAPIAELGAPLTNRPDAPIAQPVAPEANIPWSCGTISPHRKIVHVAPLTKMPDAPIRTNFGVKFMQ